MSNKYEIPKKEKRVVVAAGKFDKVIAEAIKKGKENNYFKNLYRNEIVVKLQKELNIKNIFGVPKLTSIVLSMGLNKTRDAQTNVDYLTSIGLQKAVSVRAKKSVAQFGIREGQINGAKVTLRGDKMYLFIGSLFNALIGKRDWKGLSEKSVNDTGRNLCLSFGLPDVRLFTDIKSDSMRSEGLNITFVSNATKPEHLIALLKAFDFPIKGDR